MMKMRSSACHFLLILTLTFDIYFIIGLKWISEPLAVYKCKGQTANLTWEYAEEPGDVITQLQWIFDRTKLIAYSLMNQSFCVEPNYEGRVNQSGKTGILLHNISTKDYGSYTLLPVIKFQETPNIQTVQLIVIETTVEQDCSCTNLPFVMKETNGKTYQIVVGSCKFEINSSVCCLVGLVYQYCDPSNCVSIRNLNNVTENTTQSRIVNQEKDTNEDNELINLIHNQHHIQISILVILFVGFCVTIIMNGVLIREIQHLKKNKKLIINSETVDPEYAQELHSLNKLDVRHGES